MVEAALLVGNRYSVADLQGLTDNSLGLLKRVVCDIAMALLADRRPGWNPERSKALHEAADDHLERLRKGENTFNIQASMDAGEPVADGPTAMGYDFQHLNLFRDRATRFFGPRLMPFGRGGAN